MKRWILILIIILISSFSYYGVVDKDGKRETNIQNIMQQEEEKSTVENQIEQENNAETSQESKLPETKGDSTEVQKKQETVSTKTETQTEKSTGNERKSEKSKETPIAQKKQEENKEQKTQIPVIPKEEKQEQKIETKTEEVKEKTHNCSKDGHLVSAGNTGKWFKTKAEAVEYFDKEQEKYEQEWLNGGSYEDYLAKCPYGYEYWTCPNCKYYTINFYKQ